MKLLLLGTLLVLTGCISGTVTPAQMEIANKACREYGGVRQVEATNGESELVKTVCNDSSWHYLWIDKK